jgi:sporulation protein YqfC
MNLQNIIKYINPKSYNISIAENIIYINNYEKIDTITNNNIIIIIQNKKLKIQGKDFKVKKMVNKEILFNGQIDNIETVETS